MTTEATSHQLNSMIGMANQIVAQFTGLGDQAATDEMALQHIKKFWSRDMKAEIRAFADEGGEGLSVDAIRVIKQL